MGATTAPSRNELEPFEYLDGFFYMAEGNGPPVNVLWGFWIEGEDVAEERLKRAMTRAMRCHPRASSRVRRRKTLLGGKLYWEQPAEAYDDICEFHPPDEYPDTSARLSAEVERLMSQTFDLTVGPLVRLHWYPGRSDAGLLAFHFHRSLGDGYGALQFLLDVFRCYNGERPRDSASNSLRPTARPSLLTLLSRRRELYRQRARWVDTTETEHLYDGIDVPRGELAFQFRELDLGSFEDTIASVRARGFSFNDLLLAGWARAIERYLSERGRDCANLRFVVTQNFREADAPGRFDNRSAPFPVWIPRARRDDDELLLRAIQEQVKACKAMRIAESRVQLGEALPLPRSVQRRLLRRPRTRVKGTASLMVSNLGRLAFGDTSGAHLGRGNVRSAFIVARAPEGIGAFATAATVGSRLTLALAHFDDALSSAGAARLLELTERELRGFYRGESAKTHAEG